MSAPPKKRAAVLEPPKAVELARIYTVLPDWQGILRHVEQPRRCVVCGVPVADVNFGGHDRKSALAGPLWCLRHADQLESEGHGQ